jgi:predicted secreted protein
MPHTDRIGHSTKVMRSDDRTSSGTFSTVGAVRDITPPKLARDAVETTDMESPERWKEYIGGMKDGGEFSFEMTFDPASAETTAFMTDLNTDLTGYYKFIFPDLSEWGCAALMTGFEPSVPIADKMSATITFRLTGKPGWIA